MAAIVVVAALLVVAVMVFSPFLRAEAGKASDRDALRIADLLARRDALYRQIREVELDQRTGKLEPDEHRRQDRLLRAQAIEVLRELDGLGYKG